MIFWLFVPSPQASILLASIGIQKNKKKRVEKKGNKANWKRCSTFSVTALFILSRWCAIDWFIEVQMSMISWFNKKSAIQNWPQPPVWIHSLFLCVVRSSEFSRLISQSSFRYKAIVSILFWLEHPCRRILFMLNWKYPFIDRYILITRIHYTKLHYQKKRDIILMRCHCMRTIIGKKKKTDTHKFWYVQWMRNRR